MARVSREEWARRKCDFDSGQLRKRVAADLVISSLLVVLVSAWRLKPAARWCNDEGLERWSVGVIGL
jgi:hypothetical protein